MNVHRRLNEGNERFLELAIVDAHSKFVEACELSKKQQNKFLECIALVHIAHCHSVAGNWSNATKSCEKAIEIAKKENLLFNQGHALLTLVSIALDKHSSSSLNLESSTCAVKSHDATIEAKSGDKDSNFDKTIEILQEASNIFSKLKDNKYLIKTLFLHSIVNFRMEDIEGAIDAAERCLSIIEKIECEVVRQRLQPKHLRILMSLGKYYVYLGDHQSSLENFQNALIIANAANETQPLAELHSYIGYCLFKMGKFSEALSETKTAFELISTDSSIHLPQGHFIFLTLRQIIDISFKLKDLDSLKIYLEHFMEQIKNLDNDGKTDELSTSYRTHLSDLFGRYLTHFEAMSTSKRLFNSFATTFDNNEYDEEDFMTQARMSFASLAGMTHPATNDHVVDNQESASGLITSVQDNTHRSLNPLPEDLQNSILQNQSLEWSIRGGKDANEIDEAEKVSLDEVNSEAPMNPETKNLNQPQDLAAAQEEDQSNSSHDESNKENRSSDRSFDSHDELLMVMDTISRTRYSAFDCSPPKPQEINRVVNIHRANQRPSYFTHNMANNKNHYAEDTHRHPVMGRQHGELCNESSKMNSERNTSRKKSSFSKRLKKLFKQSKN